MDELKERRRAWMWWGAGWAFRLGLSGLFIWNSFRVLEGVGTAEDLVSMALPAMWGVAQLVFAGVTLGYSFASWISRPVGWFFGALFHPQDWFRDPPEALLRSLRVKIIDRQHGSVDQQLRGLLKAYGPRPEIYHLMVLNLAADVGVWEPMAIEARSHLGRRARARFEALLQETPPGSLHRKLRPDPS